MRLLLLLFLFFPAFAFSFPKFKSETKYYDATTEREFTYLYDEIEDISQNPRLEQKIKNNIQQTIEVDNHYYVNNFSKLLVRYYFLNEKYTDIIQLYDYTLKENHQKSYISYAELLEEFYLFFYQYEITEECDTIYERIKTLKDKSVGIENEYLTFILNNIEDLRMTDESLQVKRKNILANLSHLENLEKMLDRKVYERKLARQYNFLGITYFNTYNDSAENPKNNKDLIHAIYLLKKALRINSDKSKYLAIVINSNLTYMLNKAGQYDEGLKYGLKANELLNTTESNYLLNAKVVCNLHELYECLHDLKKYNTLKKLCKESEVAYKTNTNKIKSNIIRYLKSNKRKVKNSFFGEHFILLGTGIASVFITLFYVGYQRTKNKA